MQAHTVKIGRYCDTLSIKKNNWHMVEVHHGITRDYSYIAAMFAYGDKTFVYTVFDTSIKYLDRPPTVISIHDAIFSVYLHYIFPES